MSETAPELTEFEEIDVQKVSGVAEGANGFPHLIMKGLAKDAAGGVIADTDRGGSSGSVAPAVQTAAPSHSPVNSPMPDDDDGGQVAHQPWSGAPHMHLHPANGAADGNADGLHQHMHEHNGDNDHDHGHAGADGPGIPHSSGDAGYTRSPGYGNGAAGGPTPGAAGGTTAGEMHGHGQPSAAPNMGAGKAVVGKKIDQGPDVALANQILGLLGQAMANEADEVAAGKYDESCDVGLLAQAADLVSCWRGHEQDGLLAQSALDEITEPWAYHGDETVKAHREFSADERKKQASSGNALPDGSYPIPDADALRRAAILARSKHGNWKAAMRLIARRARELGVANPITAGASSKSLLAEGAITVDTVTQGDDSLAKAVDAAVTKALTPHKERIATLEAELAKVKALPRPGGPVMSNAAAQLSAPRVNDDLAAKADIYRQKAEQATDPADAQSYRQLARKLEAEAAAKTA